MTFRNRYVLEGISLSLWSTDISQSDCSTIDSRTGVCNILNLFIALATNQLKSFRSRTRKYYVRSKVLQANQIASVSRSLMCWRVPYTPETVLRPRMAPQPVLHASVRNNS